LPVVASQTLLTANKLLEILLVQHGQIEGNLTLEDIKVFQRFDKYLEQALVSPEIQRLQCDDLPLEAE
jgi:hypothetical protein